MQGPDGVGRPAGLVDHVRRRGGAARLLLFGTEVQHLLDEVGVHPWPAGRGGEGRQQGALPGHQGSQDPADLHAPQREAVVVGVFDRFALSEDGQGPAEDHDGCHQAQHARGAEAVHALHVHIRLARRARDPFKVRDCKVVEQFPVRLLEGLRRGRPGEGVPVLRARRPHPKVLSPPDLEEVLGGLDEEPGAPVGDPHSLIRVVPQAGLDVVLELGAEVIPDTVPDTLAVQPGQVGPVQDAPLGLLQPVERRHLAGLGVGPGLPPRPAWGQGQEKRQEQSCGRAARPSVA
mmetsp:Transcript_75361/g.197539  ORF Transcript_75361/g.197539 Transcript_75361/m.197539 type:complete len:290 (+) Transcript_75361:329-1198(+)